MYFGPSQKCKALYSVNCLLVSIVIYTFALLNVVNWARTGSFTKNLSAADPGYSALFPKQCLNLFSKKKQVMSYCRNNKQKIALLLTCRCDRIFG
jgi:hypothetical protein